MHCPLLSLSDLLRLLSEPHARLYLEFDLQDGQMAKQSLTMLSVEVHKE